MPGNQDPLGRSKSTETKVVRRVGPSKTQCYISKAYKIPQKFGCDSPFFGSILVELIPETEQVRAIILRDDSSAPSAEVGISLFRFSSRSVKSGGIHKPNCIATRLSL